MADELPENGLVSKCGTEVEWRSAVVVLDVDPEARGSSDMFVRGSPASFGPKRRGICFETAIHFESWVTNFTTERGSLVSLMTF